MTRPTVEVELFNHSYSRVYPRSIRARHEKAATLTAHIRMTR